MEGRRAKQQRIRTVGDLGRNEVWLPLRRRSHGDWQWGESPCWWDRDIQRTWLSSDFFQSSTPESTVAFACTQFIHSIRHSKQRFSNLLHTEPWISYVHSSPYKLASPLASRSGSHSPHVCSALRAAAGLCLHALGICLVAPLSVQASKYAQGLHACPCFPVGVCVWLSDCEIWHDDLSHGNAVWLISFRVKPCFEKDEFCRSSCFFFFSVKNV